MPEADDLVGVDEALAADVRSGPGTGSMAWTEPEYSRTQVSAAGARR